MPPPPVARSSLLALVPEVEPAVGVHRRRLDPSSAGGVAPHVTVVHPFLPVDEVDAALPVLTALLAGHPGFDCTFADVVWFDDGLLTLAPEPADPFRALTSAVWGAFPAHPPYAGRYAPTPHLTVGYADTPLADRRWAAARIAPLLPVRARIERLTLMADDPDAGRWAPLAEIPLGPRPDRPGRSGRRGQTQGSAARWAQ